MTVIAVDANNIIDTVDTGSAIDATVVVDTVDTIDTAKAVNLADPAYHYQRRGRGVVRPAPAGRLVDQLFVPRYDHLADYRFDLLKRRSAGP